MTNVHLLHYIYELIVWKGKRECLFIAFKETHGSSHLWDEQLGSFLLLCLFKRLLCVCYILRDSCGYGKIKRTWLRADMLEVSKCTGESNTAEREVQVKDSSG